MVFVQNFDGSVCMILGGGSVVVPPMTGIFDLSFDSTFS
jgi:hypothetical protein